MAIKNNLAQLMKIKGITGLKLYELTGIAPCTISNLKNEKMVPFKSWKTRIAIALDVKPEVLFPEGDEQ